MALGLSLPGVTAEGLCHVQVATNSQKFSGRNGVAAASLGTVAGGTVPVWRQNPGIRRDLWDPPLFPASWKQRWGLGITWLWFGNPWQGRACRALGIDRSQMGPAPEHSKGRENPEPRRSPGQDGAGMGSVGLTLPPRCSDSHKTRGGRGGGAAGMLPPALGFIQRRFGISRASFHPDSASFPVIPEPPGSSREGGGFPGRG